MYGPEAQRHRIERNHQILANAMGTLVKKILIWLAVLAIPLGGVIALRYIWIFLHSHPI